MNLRAIERQGDLTQFLEIREALPVEDMLQQAGFADVWIALFDEVLLACPGHDHKCSVIIDLRHFPEFVDDIVVCLPVFKGIDLPSPRTWTERAFRLVVYYRITDFELNHFNLLPAKMTGNDRQWEYFRTEGLM
jgi:hypothetical protein